MVLRSRRRDTDAHARTALHAEAVLDDVGERVRSGRIIRRRVLQPLRAQHDAALGGRLIDTDEGHRVTVRVDARQRHRNTRHLALHGPGAQRLGNGRAVRGGGRHDLEADGRRRAVTHRVHDRVRHADDPGLRSGGQTHLVTGDKHRSQLRTRQDRDVGIQVQRQADRRAIVAQDAHRTDVVGAHLRGVRRGLGRSLLALRIRGDDAHLSGRGTRAVGDRVRKGGDIAEAAGRGNAQQVTLNEGHLEARARGHVNRLDDEHAARRVRVVGQRSDQRGATAGQHRQVVLGDRERMRVVIDHVHADDTHRRRRAVRHRVRELEGTRHGARERQDASGQIRRHGRASRGRSRRDERNRVAVRIRIIRNRVNRQGLAHAGHKEVSARHRRNIARLLDAHLKIARRLRVAVRQGHAQRLRARARTEVADLHRPVLRELHGDTIGSDHGLEEELVTVRINPIRQQVVLHLSVRADLDDRALDLARPLVLRPRVNRYAHGRGGAREAVRGLVREGRRPARQVLGNLRDLQGATAPRAHDRPELRVRHGARRQHVAVVIRVVIEDR